LIKGARKASTTSIKKGGFKLKIRKIISLLLALIMMAAIGVTAIPAASAAGNPVEMMFARGDVYGSGAFPAYASIYGYIEVENIAYSKNVTVHYSLDDKTWKDAPASYYKSAANNKEIWSFSIQDKEFSTTSDCTFAVKYEVDGKTYWDNNNGQNYKLKVWLWSFGENYAVGNVGIKVDSSSSNYAPFVSSDNVFSGPVMVKNLAYQKEVRVRYTTDNWESFTEIPANYESTISNGLEEWTFNTTLPADWSTLEYAVSYRVNGLTYWDNNFGSNYVINNSNG